MHWALNRKGGWKVSIAGDELHLPGDKTVIAEFGDYIFGEDVKVIKDCSDERV